jgi:hypothetical protein
MVENKKDAIFYAVAGALVLGGCVLIAVLELITGGGP